ncbi:MAG: tyrosine recombinase xerC-like [Clostridia bacterium]|jgi:integrase|nr:tyrosine recombinase xerC-like [Clostridia bacterium]
MLGLRRGETLGLRWQDINWNNYIISIRQSVLPTKKIIIFAYVKTESSHRDIPISKHIIDMLEEYKITQENYKKSFDRAYFDNDLICCKKYGYPYNLGAFSHMFENILLKEKIPKIRFHDLRHTNATIMLKSNISAKIASSRLGHANTSITLDILLELQLSKITIF